MTPAQLAGLRAAIIRVQDAWSSVGYLPDYPGPAENMEVCEAYDTASAALEQLRQALARAIRERNGLLDVEASRAASREAVRK